MVLMFRDLINTRFVDYYNNDETAELTIDNITMLPE